mgnify:CR=1 FL=1|jgi:hypothetical protein|tara:strand:+ start:537 stop:965 length:429 start_codon:yes stop_codon:yes gene_type:complete
MTKTELFSDENVITQSWAKWDKVGKTYQGTYVAKERKINNLKGDGSMQTIYTLIQDNGDILKVGGPGGRDLGQFAAIKPGTYVGVKYVKDIPAKKAGYNPSKQVTVFSQGEIKQDILDKYNEEHGVFASSNVLPPEPELPEM